MAGYFVANYTITNQAEYKEYLAAVGPVLQAHDAEILVADRDSPLLEGSAGQVTVVLRFATKAAARGEARSLSPCRLARGRRPRVPWQARAARIL